MQVHHLSLSLFSPFFLLFACILLNESLWWTSTFHLQYPNPILVNLSFSPLHALMEKKKAEKKRGSGEGLWIYIFHFSVILCCTFCLSISVERQQGPAATVQIQVQLYACIHIHKYKIHTHNMWNYRRWKRTTGTLNWIRWQLTLHRL